MSANPGKEKISHIPNGFTSITPYFMVSDAILFSNFLHNAFQAEIIEEHFENDVLVHGAYRVFGSVIEASQSRGEFTPNNISIHLYVPDCDAVYQKAVEAGGKPIYEVSDMPYGERSGGIEDPCGNSWWIATQQVEMYPMAK